MRICVKTMKGYSIQLLVNPGDTVEQIKAMIFFMGELPACTQRLVCFGRQMQDYFTLSHYGFDQDGIVVIHSARWLCRSLYSMSGPVKGNVLLYACGRGTSRMTP
ncbi:hypothetical protein BD324DRAFT_637599, partial [Kockovaella imperatae]